MFRRTKSEPDQAAAPVKPGGKGRPTPKRREAEAAARARVKAPRTRKQAATARREARSASAAKVREAMRTGDERNLPARDKGVVKRFTRDFVDSRLSFLQLMLPLMVISLPLGYSSSPTLRQTSTALVFTTLTLVVFDAVRLRFALHRQLKSRFPDESHAGTTWYAIVRSLQIKPLRLPKAQVKIGQALPEHYH